MFVRTVCVKHEANEDYMNTYSEKGGTA